MKRARRRSLHVLALLVLLWLIFRAGYVRHDAHDILATSLLPVAALTYALASYPRPGRTVWWAGWGICLVASIFTAARAHARSAGERMYARCYRSFIHGGEELTDVIRIVSGRPSTVSRQYHEFIRRAAAQAPLPHVDGPSDLLGLWTHRVAANGLDYLPRPTLQSYSAYSPRLAEANAAFLRNPHGPMNVFLAPDVIDGRLPALEEGPALLELLSKFDLVGSTGSHLRFRRSDSPRSVSLRLLVHERPKFLDPVTIPSTGKPIWARIDVSPTPYGRLIGALYKPPRLLIKLSVEGGVVPVRRFIPGCGRAGFILSPLLHNLESFANLGRSGSPTPTHSIYPGEFAIGAGNAEDLRRCYGSNFDVQLYEVEIGVLPAVRRP